MSLYTLIVAYLAVAHGRDVHEGEGMHCRVLNGRPHCEFQNIEDELVGDPVPCDNEPTSYITRPHFVEILLC